MELIEKINLIISIVFLICYSYQFIYIPVSLLVKRKEEPATEMTNDYAVLICARNEEEVIGDLIGSIRAQTYPSERIHVFVMADNCTDNTAEAARRAGATAYMRRDTLRVGKGYALERLLELIRTDHPEGFDGYFVFDADNILDPRYIEEMDRTFSRGHDIVTSYRNSKNYGDNWVSAGYALWFLRESRYLNGARYALGSSCAVSGTGFMFSKKVADEIAGWPYHLLTEDIEFSVDQITKGRKVAYCPEAVIYDEQPVKFEQSVAQRMRWAKGYVQVFRYYGSKLVSGCFRGSFSCFDMSMNIMPAFILSAAAMISNLSAGIYGAFVFGDITVALKAFAEILTGIYSTMFILGAVTTVTEWKRIQTGTVKKILYAFTFPVFMFTYLPVSIAALFAKVEWKPVRHNITLRSIRSRRKEECPDLMRIAGN